MKPGDHVVCIDDSPCPNGCCQIPVQAGRQYVISEARTNPHTGTLGVRITGIFIEHTSGYLKASRFRLLDELKQEARERQQKEQRV